MATGKATEKKRQRELFAMTMKWSRCQKIMVSLNEDDDDKENIHGTVYCCYYCNGKREEMATYSTAT